MVTNFEYLLFVTLISEFLNEIVLFPSYKGYSNIYTEGSWKGPSFETKVTVYLVYKGQH